MNSPGPEDMLDERAAPLELAMSAPGLEDMLDERAEPLELP